MLVALGFLIAALFVLVLMPLYRARTVRLTERRIKQSMPLTEAEIKADKDRLRADYAIKVHKLEAKVEQATLSSARQQIELNRRDAAISDLEGKIATLKSSLEEHENARRVLEQTITDRFPRVEHRLNEAKKLLFQRDREIQSLSETAARQAKALEEATQINTQQRDENLRLNNALLSRTSRTRDGLVDAKFDAEVALRNELEGLRAKNREQAALLARLQSAAGAAASTEAGAVNGAALATAAGSAPAASSEVIELHGKLAEAEAALRSLRSEASASQSGKAELEAQLRRLRAKTEDQAAEVAKLSAALKAYETAEADERSVSIKDSRIGMKAKLQSLQAENETQASTIQKMRGEIAAANERLARQAAHFMDEMRRIGAGTLPASGQPRKPAAAEAARRPLSERIVEPRPAARATLAAGATETRDQARVSGFLRALGGGAGASSPPDPEVADRGEKTAAPHAADPVAGEGKAATREEPRQPRKGRLLDRISTVAKSS